MRTLIVLRGAPGVGKSTWIEKNHLKDDDFSKNES